MTLKPSSSLSRKPKPRTVRPCSTAVTPACAERMPNSMSWPYLALAVTAPAPPLPQKEMPSAAPSAAITSPTFMSAPGPAMRTGSPPAARTPSATAWPLPSRCPITILTVMAVLLGVWGQT